jgi:hypothetical protein
MSENKTQELQSAFTSNAPELQEFVANIVFDKKNDSDVDVTYNLEEQLVLFSNNVLEVKVQSVALPNNFRNELKTESQVLHWLRDKIYNVHIPAYVLAMKYGEKFKVI